LCGRDPTLTDELLNILTELTQLSKTTNAKVALRARQVRAVVGYLEERMVFIVWAVVDTMNFYSITIQRSCNFRSTSHCLQNMFSCGTYFFFWKRNEMINVKSLKQKPFSHFKILVSFRNLPISPVIVSQGQVERKLREGNELNIS
jgi:hypothetical protein